MAAVEGDSFCLWGKLKDKILIHSMLWESSSQFYDIYFPVFFKILMSFYYDYYRFLSDLFHFCFGFKLTRWIVLAPDDINFKIKLVKS